MIKVLFVINDLGGGGAEKVLVNLVNQMNRKIFDITILAIFAGGVNQQFLSTDIKLIHIFPHSFRGNRFLFRLFTPEMLHKIMVKEKYDIEIAFLEGTPARIISGSQNIHSKKISWIHVEQGTPKSASLAFRTMNEARQCYKSFDRHVAVSKSVASDFSILFPTVRKVDVLYNPQDYKKILAMALENCEPKKIMNSNRFKIVGVGRLLPNKGFDKLIQITKKLISEGFNIETFILGSGKERNNLQKLIRKWGLEKNVFLLGYHPNPYSFIALADLFVCSSRFEGYSTATIESLILGVPAVSTPVAGVREILEDWTDFVVSRDFSTDSLYQTIRDLIADQRLYERYRASIPQISSKFIDGISIRLIESYLTNLINDTQTDLENDDEH